MDRNDVAFKHILINNICVTHQCWSALYTVVAWIRTSAHSTRTTPIPGATPVFTTEHDLYFEPVRAGSQIFQQQQPHPSMVFGTLVNLNGSLAKELVALRIAQPFIGEVDADVLLDTYTFAQQKWMDNHASGVS